MTATPAASMSAPTSAYTAISRRSSRVGRTDRAVPNLRGLRGPALLRQSLCSAAPAAQRPASSYGSWRRGRLYVFLSAKRARIRFSTGPRRLRLFWRFQATGVPMWSSTPTLTRSASVSAFPGVGDCAPSFGAAMALITLRASALGRSRTGDLPLRRRLLCPLSYQGGGPIITQIG